MKNNKLLISMILLIAGFVFVIIGTVQHYNYPGMKEMMWAATVAMWKPNTAGILLLICSYLVIKSRGYVR